MVFITINKKELTLLLVFAILFLASLVGISTLQKEAESVPVIAIEEYLIHEGSYYQRTLVIVSVIDQRLIPVSTHYEGRPLYKETNVKFPARLLWPLGKDQYAVFSRVKN